MQNCYLAKVKVDLKLRNFCRLSVCHYVCSITAKINSQFHWNLVLWLDNLGLPVGRINFWWWSCPRYGFRITFPLPSPLQNRGFIRISHSHRPIFTTLGEMTRCWQGDESTTYWEWSGRRPDPNLD